jgi:tetratricopeptide (TPR) repeat protein
MKDRRFAPLWIAILVGGALSANLVGGPLNRLFLAMPGVDKVLHVGFQVLLFVFVRQLATTAGATGQTPAILAAGIGVAVSLVDELLQSLTWSRIPEAADLVAGWSGLGLAWGLTSAASRRTAMIVVAVAAGTGSYVTYQTHLLLRDYARGLQFESQGDLNSARESYLKALAAGLRSADLYNALGWVEAESGNGDPQRAVAWAGTAMAMRPDDPDILDTYGWALHRATRSREALAYLLRAYDAKPDMYCIHYHLGATYLALEEREKAHFHLSRQADLSGTREAALARAALGSLGGGAASGQLTQ